jgi:hypothetical protein
MGILLYLILLNVSRMLTLAVTRRSHPDPRGYEGAVLRFVYVKQSAVMFHNDCAWKLMTVTNNAQRVTPDVQALFCRRRHQARRSPLAKMPRQ